MRSDMLELNKCDSPAKKVTSAEPIPVVDEDEAPVFFIASGTLPHAFDRIRAHSVIDQVSVLDSASAAIQQMLEEISQHVCDLLTKAEISS